MEFVPMADARKQVARQATFLPAFVKRVRRWSSGFSNHTCDLVRRRGRDSNLKSTWFGRVLRGFI